MGYFTLKDENLGTWDADRIVDVVMSNINDTQELISAFIDFIDSEIELELKANKRTDCCIDFSSIRDYLVGFIEYSIDSYLDRNHAWSDVYYKFETGAIDSVVDMLLDRMGDDLRQEVLEYNKIIKECFA